ncbi:AhpA/YtjB family protein [Candidatus Colwellia aromaticivorans]|uniref:AhpA/YtjB family protein n=1 Tax=Candidatus Colwellia aromaticivorans TaxID=2267621 RepID=UPI000DF2D4E3|nr:AhpA/YtjB family protein [Candidatus Colwellia aromaticivorans]
MKQSEQPLYPKLSPIYNKILQLLSAILLIVLLMTLWVSTSEKSEQVLSLHFEQTADKFLQQAIAGISVLLAEKTTSQSKKSRNAQLQSYLNHLGEADFIKQVHLYDETGLLLLKSVSGGEASASIKSLYGIDESLKTLNKSGKYSPFVSEIRTDKLIGYLRLTIEKSYLTATLAKDNENSQTLYRFLLIIAGVVGFLLTRGLNRFSRQGFRMPDINTK